MDKIKQFVESSPNFIPVITMSATICKIDRATVAGRMGVEDPTVIHGLLSQRGEMVRTIMTGNPAITTKSITTEKFQAGDHIEIES